MSKFTTSLGMYYVCKSQDRTTALCDVFLPEQETKRASNPIDMDLPQSMSDWRAIIQTILSSNATRDNKEESQKSINAIISLNVTSFLKIPSKLTLMKE